MYDSPKAAHFDFYDSSGVLDNECFHGIDARWRAARQIQEIDMLLLKPSDASHIKSVLDSVNRPSQLVGRVDLKSEYKEMLGWSS